MVVCSPTLGGVGVTLAAEPMPLGMKVAGANPGGACTKEEGGGVLAATTVEAGVGMLSGGLTACGSKMGAFTASPETSPCASGR